MPDSPQLQTVPDGASPSSDIRRNAADSRRSALPAMLGGRGTAYLVLVLSLAVTALGWEFTRRAADQRMEQEFDALVREISDDIQARMIGFEDALRASRAFILASGHISRDEWIVFQDAQRLEVTHPGMLGIGLTQEVYPAGLDEHIRRMRAEGNDDYRVWPPGNRPAYAPIRFAAAYIRDVAAVGFDMYSDPVRKAAMERARDTGKTALSELTVIKMGAQNGRESILLYLPVYGRALAPDTPVGQRRTALVSYVYTPLLVVDFMRDIAAKVAEKNLAMRITGKHGATIFSVPAEFPEHGEGLSSVKEEDMYGQPWSIRFQAMPGFASALGGTGAMFLASGGIINLLLFSLVWTLTSIRLRAEGLAREMTRDLRESEARFKSLTHLSSDWYWEQDENYRFTANSGGGLGWSKRAIVNTLGKTRWELPDTGMAEADWAVHRAVLEARRPFKDLIYNRFEAGVLHQISVSGEPFFDARGTFRGYRGIGSDITERLRRDNALLESEARFRNAFDSAAIGMAIVSLDGQWLQVNPPLCQMLGYTEPELKKLTFQDITHPDDLQANLEHQGRVRRGETPSYQMEKRYFHQDGHVVWALLSVSMVRGTDGTPLHFVAQIQDITARKQTELELAANRRFLADLIDAIPLPLTVKDDNRRFVIVNEANVNFHHRPAGDFLGKLDSDFYAPERVKQIWAEDDAVVDSGTPLEEEQPFQTTSGELRWVIKYKRRIVSPDGRRWLIIALLDITERKLAEIALQQSEARFRALTELSSDFYWEQDENFRFTAMSAEVEKAVGMSSQSHIGKTRWEVPGIILSKQERAAHRAILDAHRPFSDFTYQRLGPDGGKRYLSISGQPMFDEQGKFTGYRGIGKDVTAAKVAEVRIQYLAYHDNLTTLPNRSSFSLILNHGIAGARRDGKKLAVLFIDLDRFKNINDTLGHDAGDALLREIGGRLRHCIRQSDSVARLGGDEFVVLLEEISAPGHVAKVARKILSDIADALNILGQEFRVTASIGISIYPQDGEDEQTLMKNADIAMYHAKQEGKNNFQFHSAQMNTHTLERLALESSLRRALEREEFQLYYQDKMDLGSSRVTGMEALLRWQHPDLGMVPPAQFIPIAEETGLIGPIGQWVIRTACLQNKAWQDRGLPSVRVAVNLSPRQFTDDNLAKSIAAILKETGMNPNCLELEITESMIMYNVDKTMQKLITLGKMGIRIAIDDFGTGHSSLAYLKRFPIDTLKIDRSFISDLPGDAEDKAIAAAIITMGKSLDLTVVAEGVETRDQLDFLRAHGCDEFQGYYAHKPMPAEQFAKVLQAEMDASLTGDAVASGSGS
jgi:diguanylate cyclase (GGDEF)-like protein/PAS domain S-box-containing protein